MPVSPPVEEAAFIASLPFTSALSVGGDGAAVLRLEIPLSDLAAVVSVLRWIDVPLEVRVRPAKRMVMIEKVHTK